MTYRGDIRLGDTIHCKFVTTTSAGVPTQLAGSPVISAYPAASTTQLTAGITLTVDFDSVTGLNHVTVVATSGNGYLTATNYELVVTTGTVGGVSVVGYVIGSFSIENRSALMPTTAARTLLVDASGRIATTTMKRLSTLQDNTDSTHSTLDASATTAHCQPGDLGYVESGTGAGNSNVVQAFDNTTKIVTWVQAWATAPGNPAAGSVVSLWSLGGLIPVVAQLSASGKLKTSTDEILGDALSLTGIASDGSGKYTT